MQPIAAALASLSLGEPAQFRNMTVFPLYAPAAAPPAYLLLDEALERKVAHVTEVSESGTVPELLFVNDGDGEVLLVDGEELVGARQNRILNVSLLVGGRRRIVIPVSCVEQGRWHSQSTEFETAPRTLFAQARARKMRHVSASMRESGSRYSNQAEIWSDIDARAASLRVHSGTASMGDIFDQRETQIGDYAQAFSPQPRQAGAIFGVNGRIAGIELFDSEATFGKFMRKVLRSYAMDAIEDEAPAAMPPVTEAVRKFIAAMQAAAVERFPALGEGEDLRFESGSIAGGALYAGNRIVHLCAFEVPKSSHRPIGRGGAIDFEIPAFLRRGYRAR